MAISPDARAVLEVGDETEVAHILLGESPFFPQGPDAPLHGIVYDEGALWQAQPSGLWQQVEDHDVYKLVMAFSGMPKPTQGGGENSLKVGANFCRGVRQQVEALRAQKNFFADGAWGIAFRSKFLRIDRNGAATLEDLTPDHRVRFALDFDYDPNAPVPEQFLAFLQSMWGDPPDSMERVNLLLEWIGYLLSGRTDYQKMLLLIGPPRSGKGTILRVIQKMFGPAAGPFKFAALGDRFHTGNLRGKSVTYDPDVRRSSIVDGSESRCVELALSITGEDAITLEQKYRDAVSTKLGARLMLCTNPPFKMSDVGAALSTRLLVLTMERSFLGKEDLQLESRLCAEIPGIVRLAVMALQQLSERGRFVEPAASAETRREIEIAETPLLAFFEDCCEFGETFTIPCAVLYDELSAWCQRTGHRKPNDSTFGGTLKRMGIFRVRPNQKERRRHYLGVRLLPAEEAPGTPRMRLHMAS
jgi:P4 family phage/plasmid primase-like protien